MNQDIHDIHGKYPFSVPRGRVKRGDSDERTYELRPDRIREEVHVDPDTGEEIVKRVKGMSAFGDFLKRLNEAGLSQSDLGKIMGIAQPHLSRMKKYGLRNAEMVAALEILLEEAIPYVSIPKDLRAYSTIYTSINEERWRQHCREELYRILAT